MKLRYLNLGAILGFIISLFIFNNVSALDETEIVITAINAGGKENAGEFIELQKLSSDSILLTGLSIRYQNASGSVDKIIYSFPEGTSMTGESLLLRHEKTPEAEMADLTYNVANLAQGGGKISLVIDEDEEIDSVCWGSYPNCEYKKFSSDKPTSLVKNFEAGLFEHLADYEPEFDKGRIVLIFPDEPEEETPIPQCRALQFSEIFTYYESSKSEQFVEFFNSDSTQIKLDGCFLRYKNKTYPLEGVVQPEGYSVRYANDFTLTKNPTNSNILEIIDTDGKVVDSLTYFNGQKKAMAYAMFGYDENGKEKWLQTFAQTPGNENDYQKYKTCESGKVLNEETGNCVKITTISTSLTPCPEGSYRNPLTNRCKKYETTANASLKPCAEGYERNPETNRCRKVVSNNGTTYPLASMETYEEKSSFVAISAIICVGILGALYVIFQYRVEILGLFRKR